MTVRSKFAERGSASPLVNAPCSRAISASGTACVSGDLIAMRYGKGRRHERCPNQKRKRVHALMLARARADSHPAPPFAILGGATQR
jgi:hypothetical protein